VEPEDRGRRASQQTDFEEVPAGRIHRSSPPTRQTASHGGSGAASSGEEKPYTRIVVLCTTGWADWQGAYEHRTFPPGPSPPSPLPCVPHPSFPNGRVAPPPNPKNNRETRRRLFSGGGALSRSGRGAGA